MSLAMLESEMTAPNPGVQTFHCTPLDTAICFPIANMVYVAAGFLGYVGAGIASPDLKGVLLGVVFLAGLPLLATMLGNQCTLRVRLNPGVLSVRIHWRSISAKALDIKRITYTANAKYADMIVETTSGGFVLNSMLWSKEMFLAMESQVDLWCRDNSVTPPEKLDLFGFDRSPDEKQRLVLMRRLMGKGRLGYAAGTYASVGLGVLVRLV